MVRSLIILLIQLVKTATLTKTKQYITQCVTHYSMQLYHIHTIESQFGRAGVCSTFDSVFSDIAGDTFVDGEALRDTVTHYLVFFTHGYLFVILIP